MKKIEPMKKEDIKQLANDMNKGLVFTDRHISGLNSLPMVFMPLAIMSAKKEWIDQVGLIYEYLDKAGPRSINGMPMFMSMKIVPKADVKELYDYMKKYKEAEAAVK